jgi:hypothetical protein
MCNGSIYLELVEMLLIKREERRCEKQKNDEDIEMQTLLTRPLQRIENKAHVHAGLPLIEVQSYLWTQGYF